MVDETPNVKYTREHEWVRLEDDGTATIGITDYAQDSLGDIVFVELPDIGDTFDGEEVLGVVESVKTTSDVYMPIAGEVIAVNEALADNPAVVNEDPYSGGWLVRIQPRDTSEIDALMTPADYTRYLAEEQDD